MKHVFREVRRINWRQTFWGSKKRIGVTMLISIPAIVGATALGYQFYLQQNPALVYAHKLQNMTAQVSKTVSLPIDETPVVATVTDHNILPKETFFSYARNGDKILMYKKHKLAVLYRPSIKAVITQATLDFRNATPKSPAGSGASAVAGASTSASSAPVSVPSPTVAPAPTGQNSGTNTYHPDGKILVLPK